MELRIPSWITDYCLQDLNTGTKDWMNHPFLYPVDGENWVIATDGFSLIALKTPVADSQATGVAYLKELDISYIKTFVHALFQEQDSEQMININKLKSQLTSLGANRTCSNCNNTKQAVCGECDGSTEVSCSRCEGKGAKPCVTCQKPDACEPCDGLGVVECSTCHEGKVPCSCVDSENQDIVQVGRGHLNLPRLKSLLKNFHGECKVFTSFASTLFRGNNWLACLAGISSVDTQKSLNIDLASVV